MAQKKVYGLILPGKKGQVQKKETPTAFNIFGDDESDDEEKSARPVGPFGQTSNKTKLKKQSQMDIEKAMMDDPTVYEYDEIYDEMQASKPKVGRDRSEKEKQDKKPRYITGLLKAAEVRKKEEERRNERKVQKEREAEGEKYADKESFVTSAYKRKMLEMQEEEERGRREAEIEALTDVTKQKDMSGFYRYLYRQTGDGANHSKEESPKGVSKKQDDHSEHVKEEPVSPKPRKRSSSSSSQSSHSSHSSRDDMKDKQKSTSQQTQPIKKTVPSKRNFRQRRADSSSEDDVEQASRGNDRHMRQPVNKAERSLPANRSRSRSKSLSPRRSENYTEKWRKRKNERRHSLSQSPESEKRPSKSRKHQRRHSPSPSPDEKKRVHRRSPMSEDKEKSRHSRSRSPADRRNPPNRQTSSLKSQPNGAPTEKAPSEEVTVGPKWPSMTSAPVNPAKKIYPHHNSPKDIADARNRYLARKLERERGRAI